MGIFSRIFGDKSLADLDSKVDELVNFIPKRKDQDSSEDITGKIVNSFLSNNDNDDEVAKVFRDVAIPTERLMRYNTYDEVYKAIPIVRRIIKVYIANILPKNPVDGKCFLFRRTNKDISKDDKNIIDSVEKFDKNIVEEFHLVEKMKQLILPRRLLYGDSFVEIVDVKKEVGKINLTQPTSILQETIEIRKLEEEIDNLKARNLSRTTMNGNFDFILNKIADIVVDFEEGLPAADRMILEQEKANFDNQQNTDNKNPDESKNTTISNDNDLSDILFKVHKPHQIIILDTKYGSRIGYLEVAKKDALVQQNIGLSLAKIIGKVTSIDAKHEMSQEKLVNKLIYFVLKKIMAKAKPGSNSTDIESIVKSMGDDVYMFVKRMFIEQGIYKNKQINYNQIKVRFIPPDRMVQFSNPGGTDYTPFSESVVESLILPGKLYILAQLANAITKLSRASLIRKWRIDVGSSQMHSGMIQRLKRELYNTRVSLADLTSFKSIPKILSD